MNTGNPNGDSERTPIDSSHKSGTSEPNPVPPQPSPTPAPPEKNGVREPVKRVGISDQTLIALGIRHVEKWEAYKLTGHYGAGIYIPFHGVMDKGAAEKSIQPFGRLRIKNVVTGKKYHQRWKTKVHNYIQPNFTLVDGDILLVEGEFKSISLTEAGFPAIGLAGFYTWSQKWLDHSQPRRIEPGLAATIAKLKPQRLVYFGDADVATNCGFWNAMTQMSHWTGLPVALPRIEYSAPNGKGVDDIRGKLSPDEFAHWVKEAIKKAEIVLPSTTQEELMSRLLDREHESIRKLTGDDREKAKERLTKSGAMVTYHTLDTLAEFAEATLGVKPASFKKDAKAHAKKKREEEQKKREEEQKKREEEQNRHSNDTTGSKPWVCGSASEASSDPSNGSSNAEPVDDASDGPLTDDGPEEPVTDDSPGNYRVATRENNSGDGSVLEQFFMIGKEFYGYTFDPATNKRSKTVSLCDKAYVSYSLKAAGYNSKMSDEETPVCGRVRNLSRYHAALFYLHATRFVGMADRLFRPYGPMLESDGTRIFNNSQVQVTKPASEPVSFHDSEIEFTIKWLSYLLPGNQLDHFLTLLSYVYCAALANTPKKTRAVFLVGGPNSGKSLLIDYFIPRIFGQKTAANAQRLFKGEVGASSVLKSYVCKLSDADLGGTGEVQRIQQGILSLLADHTTSGRLMFQNVTTEEVINLFMFSTNPDGSTVNLLRDMPESIKEKFAVYDCGDGIEAVRNPPIDNSGIVESQRVPADVTPKLDKELPCFCSLLKEWQKSKVHWDAFGEERFGVISYYAKSLTRHFNTDDEEDMVVQTLRKKDFTEKRAYEIFEAIVATDSCPRQFVSIRPARFSRILTNLSRLIPSLVQANEYKTENGSGVKNRFFNITGTSYDIEADRLAKIAEREASPEYKREIEEYTKEQYLREAVAQIPADAADWKKQVENEKARIDALFAAEKGKKKSATEFGPNHFPKELRFD